MQDADPRTYKIHFVLTLLGFLMGFLCGSNGTSRTQSTPILYGKFNIYIHSKEINKIYTTLDIPWYVDQLVLRKSYSLRNGSVTVNWPFSESHCAFPLLWSTWCGKCTPSLLRKKYTMWKYIVWMYIHVPENSWRSIT